MVGTMSRREEALQVLFEMLSSDDNKDRISAAGQILKSTNVAEEHTKYAVKVLTEIMNDEMAEPRDRVNAAAKLKDYAPKQRTERDEQRILAMMTDEELQAAVDTHELAPAVHPLLQ